jgi:hypothetical protein
MSVFFILLSVFIGICCVYFCTRQKVRGHIYLSDSNQPMYDSTMFSDSVSRIKERFYDGVEMFLQVGFICYDWVLTRFRKSRGYSEVSRTNTNGLDWQD